MHITSVKNIDNTLLSEISIRTAEISDIAPLRELAYVVWPATYNTIISQAQLQYMLETLYSTDHLMQQMALEENIFRIVAKDQQCIGYTQLVCLEQKVRISKIYIHTDYQGCGIGRALMDDAELIAKSLDAEALMLYVNRKNPALSFYRKLGFCIVDEIDIPFGEYTLQDYILEKKLPVNI